MPIPQRTALLTLMRLENKHAADIRRILERSSKQVAKDIAALGKDGNALTRMQLQAQKASIDAMLKQDFSDIGNIIGKGTKEAAAAASRVVSMYESELLSAVMTRDMLDALATSEARRAASGIEAALRRMEGSSYIPLSRQVYKTTKLAGGMVDDIINQALVSGWDARRLAREVSSSINPNVPGGVSYAANRLARTEINNAFHASTAKRYVDSGIVDGADWNLSTSHPEGDICDSLKDNSPYELDEIPQKPHPHCYCYLTPHLPEPDEFIDNLLSGKYGDEPWIDDVSEQKVADTFLSAEDIAKMDKQTALKALSKRQEALIKYADSAPDRSKLMQDAIYLAQQKEKNALFSHINKLNAAERAEKLLTHPKIDKLPRMEPPATMRGSYRGGAANPNGRNFPGASGERDYQINCTRVSYAVEMRMRGYDVTAAKAGEAANKSDAWIKANWVDPKTGKARPLKKAATEQALMRDMAKNAPDGARFFVIAAWKRGSAHIWNAEKVGGKIVFHEGQIDMIGAGSEAFTRDRLKDMAFDEYKGTVNSVRWMRVDDLEPTDYGVSRGWIEVNGKVVKNPR